MHVVTPSCAPLLIATWWTIVASSRWRPVLLGEGIALFTQAEQVRRFKLEAVNQYDQFAELVYSR